MFKLKAITRRKFIAQSLVIACASFSVDITFSATKKEARSLKYDSSFYNECQVVYHEWMENEDTSPEDYLKNIQDTRAHSTLKISEATRRDFDNNQIFSVKGLQLGKTEAAFIALIGSTLT